MPIRKLITDVPAPGRDHRKNEPTTLLEQNLIDIGIVQTDLLRHMGNVEFDGASATRLEVDEEQAVRGARAASTGCSATRPTPLARLPSGVGGGR
jgi:hypothetical protein